MKNILFLFLWLLVLPKINAQGIRKNYNEMTQLERDNLVNAFYQLRNGPDLINDMAVFHGAFFNFDDTPNANQPDLHFNLPDEAQRDIFLAWHRYFLFELEQAMKDINPYISIPYWNTTIDRQTNSPLWNQNFLGQFNADWDLNRNFGVGGSLPMPTDLTQVQAQGQFLTYSNMLERGPIHHGAHRWIGGAMAATVSPRDPAFFLHHAYVDKVWQDWENVRQSSSFIMNSMIRYNGTYTFNGQTLPSVNPNNIVDSRALGTFYAENELAVLDDYNVTNTNANPEIYFYQHTIQAQNGFEVPANRTARFESVNRIRLLPGFHAHNGSNFIATIGNGTAGQKSEMEEMIVRNQNPWDNRGIPIDWDAYKSDFLQSEVVGKISIHPNPFTDRIRLITKEAYDHWRIEIFDLQGRRLFEKQYANANYISLKDVGSLPMGTYLIKVTINGSEIQTTTIIKQ